MIQDTIRYKFSEKKNYFLIRKITDEFFGFFICNSWLNDI